MTEKLWRSLGTRISVVSVVRIKIHLFCQFQVVEENLVRLEACMLEEHLLGEHYVTHAQYTVTLFYCLYIIVCLYDLYLYSCRDTGVDSTLDHILFFDCLQYGQTILHVNVS